VANRLIPLALSLLLLLIGPGWAPAGFEARGRGPIDEPPRLAFAVKPAPASSALPSAAPTTRAIEALSDYALYVPSDAARRQPLRVLVALHGMGGNGPDFSRPLLPLAEKFGWVVLAPTLPYRDFRDPELVRRDGELHPRLKALLDTLPGRTGFQLQPRVLFYGFSRGSQEAHRFSLMYPEATLGVAGLSAGSYTLPSKTFRQNAQDQVLRYPFGTADVDQICGRAFNPEAAQKVSFWIGVGGRDDRVEDVPRQWDPYVGQTRVERAQRFVGALQQLGARAELAVFPSAAHELTDPMREGALSFLASLAS
jgi:predicted esterase